MLASRLKTKVFGVAVFVPVLQCCSCDLHMCLTDQTYVVWCMRSAAPKWCNFILACPSHQATSLADEDGLGGAFIYHENPCECFV